MNSTDYIIRDCNDRDFDAIVGLNEIEVQHTSPLSVTRLRELDKLACYHRCVEIDNRVIAFLIAMRDGCGYQNANYEWFTSRYSKLIYIDRIIVDAKYSGMKIGTCLYNDIFEYAKLNDISTIACEYNVVPANEPSCKFHNKFGFVEAGEQWLNKGTKKVSMQIMPIK